MENKTNPLVSIIIPHYNNYLILEECIKSLKKNQYNNIEIIVVDNASKDDSVLQIENNFPDIIIKKSKRNLGYAGGCNFGSKNAKARTGTVDFQRCLNEKNLDSCFDSI